MITWGIVSALTDALPPGSYVAASHSTAEHFPEGMAGAGRAYSDRGMRGALRGQEPPPLVPAGRLLADERAVAAIRGNDRGRRW